MAITFATGGYPNWAATPDPIIISGLVPGSRLTYDWAVATTQSTPVTEYEERLYFYADPNGRVRIERSALKQRACAALYTTLINQNATTLEGRWKATRFRYLDACTGIDAATTEETDVTFQDFYYIWAAMPLQVLPNADTRYRLYSSFTGGWFLTKATRLEVNKYLPHSLIYYPHTFNTDSGFTYKGPTTQTMNLTAEGAVHTQYLAATYGDGEWTFGRTHPLLPGYKLYNITVSNCVEEVNKVKREELVYLRWLNSLGGLSYGVFEVRARGLAVSPRVRARDYTSQVATSTLFQSDVETLSKEALVSLTIGRGMVGWDRFEDLEDLTTSIEVLRYDANSATFQPVQISGGSNGDRSKQYNDFSCVLTMPQSFTQIR